MNGGAFTLLIFGALAIAAIILIAWASRRGSSEPVSTSDSLLENIAVQAASRAEPLKSDTPRISFDRMMTRVAAENEAKWMSATLAGYSHRNQDGSSRQQAIRELYEEDELGLEREPDNPHSSHAVRVTDLYNVQVGYLPEWLARDVADALDSGGYASCYVRHTRQVSARNWTAAIGVAWRAKLSPRVEFRAALDRSEIVEEWFWAKLSRVSRPEAQEHIARLTSHEMLTLEPDGNSVLLKSSDGVTIAALCKQHAEQVTAGWNDGRQWAASVFEVRERTKAPGLEPVVAIMLLKEDGH